MKSEHETDHWTTSHTCSGDSTPVASQVYTGRSSAQEKTGLEFWQADSDLSATWPIAFMGLYPFRL